MKLSQKDNFQPISFVFETRQEAKLMVEMFRTVDYLERSVKNGNITL